MTTRPKNEGLVYMRRSDSRQETSLESQVTWAISEARKLDVKLQASSERLGNMLVENQHHSESMFLDNGISGASFERPGLLALIAHALATPTVSHIFVHKRDRLGRPDDVVRMMGLEQSLTQAGITIVLSDGIVPPSRRGQVDLPHVVNMLFGYHQSGEFLNHLAERVILTQQFLAKQGFHTGGNPPYGFGRFLVGPDGEVIEELPPGRRVRQPGCHVRILPKDRDKIAVWLFILDLKHQGWGLKRIIRHLNELGIPSPNAGRIRKDQGVPHVVSGKWSHNTVADLCRNKAILGIQVYGQRSEGSHRRLGQNGPRLLEDADQTLRGNPRVIRNDPSLRIESPIGFEPEYNPKAWDEIQEQMDSRSTSQRGVRRAKDLGKYPLASRVFDMTEQCGSVMYGLTNGKRLYKCGRYQRSGGEECHHNTVDAEALLRLTLRTLRQCVSGHGDREKLRQLLEARAANELRDDSSRDRVKLGTLQARVQTLQGELATAGRRMTIEQDDERYQTLAAHHDRIKAELAQAEEALREAQASAPPPQSRSPAEEVNAAMLLLDQIGLLAKSNAAREDLGPLLAKIGMRVGLEFGSEIKGKKREVRTLRRGVIAFGDAPLPVPIHGRDNRSPAALPSGCQHAGPAYADQPLINGSKTASAELPLLPAPEREKGPANISLTMVNRGDMI